jgi:P4 family phage/plasmid primase-like protien
MMKPRTFSGDLGALPAALGPLTQHRRWVIWKWEEKKESKGKWTKTPYRANNPRVLASSTNPTTWSTYAAALAAVKAGKADGIGYMLTHAEGLANGVGALDLDYCRDLDTGDIAPWAQELIEEARHTYVETTVSGTGLRIIGLVDGGQLHKKLNTADGGSVELYRHAERYITVTGLQSGSCTELQDIDELIDRAYERFKKDSAGESPKVDMDALPTVNVDALLIGDKLKQLIKEGGYEQWQGHRSKAVYHVCCSLIRSGIADEVILAILLDTSLRISDHCHDQADPRRAAKRALKAALKMQPRPVIVSDTDHLERARLAREKQRPHLLHHRDDFIDWEKGAYRIIEAGTITAELWNFLDNAIARRKISKRPPVWEAMPFRPNRHSVAETLAALKAISHLNPDIESPCFLDDKTEPPPCELVAFPNGLLDLRSGELLPPDPAFFTFAALGFDYEPKGADPTAWMDFLKEIFDGEDDQIEALQEVFGYLITGDVSLEKAILMLGPKRSGKGTMLRMLRSLLASLAVADPSLRFLGTNFGLASLIGKQVAIIDDLRVGPRSEQDVLIENLLKITGRGRFTIDRKFQKPWHGPLPVKLVMVSNEMPKLGDESAAVASRFIIFNTRVSFYGREDPHLFEKKLEPERVGVLHWALEGLRRVRERGRLIEPEESKELQDRMANLGSDARVFIAENCVVEPDATMLKDDLFRVYRVWCKRNEIYPWTKEKFCQALYAATDNRVRSEKLRKDGGRAPSFVGIRLRRAEDEA